MPLFEVIVTLCLAAAPGTCRDVLLPGHEAATEAACLASLDRAPVAALPEGVIAAGPVCVPVGEALGLDEVAPGILVHRGAIAEADGENGGDMANLGVVIGARSVAVIDTGSARWMGEAIWRAVRARTDLPVSHVILTHMHPDHVFGATVLAEAGAEVVGHEGLARALADRQQNYLESLAARIGAGPFIGTAVAPVDVEVADAVEIDLGGRVLEVRAWPTAHTGTDLTVLDRDSGVLFVGDLVFDKHLPTLDGSLRGWQVVLAELVTIPARAVVPGHGGPVLSWPDGVQDTARYLDLLARDTRAAIDRGERLSGAVGDIAAGERDRWELFDEHNARNATVAFTELEWE
ncbi:quinoprotein relay system zinc metallohydrolase 2 [Rhodovulum tesquicola]|uniref:quinoprotein relay system zinc metallohydrolase 2 n=1 Tax=Rhodovulum tesquicola TaxID=540254 RepID=UPI003395C8BC